jgi:putative component of membrane protein insertase Oxa1/YidC/SpoIIIJ protein YidD
MLLTPSVNFSHAATALTCGLYISASIDKLTACSGCKSVVMVIFRCSDGAESCSGPWPNKSDIIDSREQTEV